MKTGIFAAALFAIAGTAATAQGIQPVATTPATDVTVGTLAVESSILLAVVGGAALIAIASAESSDGTN